MQVGQPLMLLASGFPCRQFSEPTRLISGQLVGSMLLKTHADEGGGVLIVIVAWSFCLELFVWLSFFLLEKYFYPTLFYTGFVEY